MTDDAVLFDVDSVRRLETAARESLVGEPLMERAGRAAWRVLLERWPAAHRIVVACGRGGNGGDGYVLARCALESGREVHVIAIDGVPPAAGDARAAHERFVAAGGRVEALDGGIPAADVVVDALLGIGRTGPLSQPMAAFIEAIIASAAPVLALDVPSGLGGDAPGAVVRAAATIEFLLPKLMLRTGPAVDATGVLRLASLDVPDGLRDGIARAAIAVDAGALRRWLAPRDRDSHKGRNGRVLCVGGAAGSGGAILLCAEAALRTGAGLVRVHTDPAHVGALLARTPEAMVSTDAMPPLDRADVVAIGPGLGQGGWGAALWSATLAAAIPAVVDADALNLLAADPRVLPADWVLTPHPGEAARLLGSDIAAIQRDRPVALHALVERFGCVVVLKGAGTLVGAPGQTPRLVAAGNPALATGGTGDVLTGVIASLRAQGLEPFDAALCGAVLHAAAGDVAAGDGARGLRASDLMAPLRRLANP